LPPSKPSTLGFTATRDQAIDKLVELREKARPAAHAMIAKLQTQLQAGGRVDMLRAVIASAPDDPESILALKAILGPGNRTGFGRKDVLQYLVKWAGADDDRRKEVIPLLKAGFADPRLAAASAQFAGDLGKAAGELLPALKDLKLSKNADIRTAATAAVEKIEKP
jgi:hypothetical protein